MKKVQNMRVQNHKAVGIFLIFTGCIFLLTGCQNKFKWSESRPGTAASTLRTPQKLVAATPPTPASPPAAEPAAPSSAERGRIGLCQSELASLQKINPAVYAAKKASFDNLVRNASVYTSVRGDINAQTKDTLDALYKYKTNQMCGEIQRAVMEGLIRRGESVK
ncbi:TPA: hypothetical protein ACXE8V_003166 [Pluralibacter gergoviae]